VLVISPATVSFSSPILNFFSVLLPQTSQAIPLDQLLKDEEFPETERLLRSTGLKHLNQVADRKGMEMGHLLK
jgi:hypothetical protein